MPVESSPVGVGYVSKIPICSIVNERYITGLYQNLVVPSSFAYTHSPEISQMVDDFEAALEGQVVRERERFDPGASSQKCHPRFAIMPPAIPGDILEKIW